MRIVQANKFFYPHAGTETVLFHTRELLRSRGHDVIDFAMHDARNSASGDSAYFTKHRDYGAASRPVRLRDGLASIYSFEARRRVRQLVDERRPQVAHLHGIYHQLTLAVVDEFKRLGVPVVMTIHDYKLACPSYTMYRNGRPCRLCVDGPVENVAIHRCMKGSVQASLIAAAEARLVRHLGSYQKLDAVAAPSAFAARIARDAGIPASRLHVLPNFLPHRECGPVRDWTDNQPQFFFAGRLEEVKGVGEMIEAFGSTESGATLVLAGAGGDLEDVVQRAGRNHRRIDYRGRMTRAEVAQELRRSRAALMPSKWFENYPMSVLEARAAGVAVVATAIGGLPEMVSHDIDGLLVPPGDADALRHAVEHLTRSPDLAREMGETGFQRLLESNTEEAHYEQLMAIYESIAL